jgi:hypothetical protein
MPFVNIEIFRFAHYDPSDEAWTDETGHPDLFLIEP